MDVSPNLLVYLIKMNTVLQDTHHQPLEIADSLSSSIKD